MTLGEHQQNPGGPWRRYVHSEVPCSRTGVILWPVLVWLLSGTPGAPLKAVKSFPLAADQGCALTDACAAKVQEADP